MTAIVVPVPTAGFRLRLHIFSATLVIYSDVRMPRSASRRIGRPRPAKVIRPASKACNAAVPGEPLILLRKLKRNSVGRQQKGAHKLSF